MTQKNISLQLRRELLNCTREKYNKAGWKEKIKIVDGFIAATGYNRKYAICRLNATKKIERQNPAETLAKKKNKVVSKTYTEEIRQTLLTIWYASNQICSKRLVPFLPELIASLERNGHLSLSLDEKQKILKISSATVDRLLKKEREIINRGISTTRPGSLIKKQIQVRTFADWDDASPGFIEADLVAHCGNRTNDSFLNTLVLTDIASTWTEFLPLLRKGENEVIRGLKIAQKLFPFPLLGLDTDNGSEFINYKLLQFCEEQKITFTRSRAYHSNDQAHVEEKNGSIIRKIVGYDRYEGNEALKALSALYVNLRLYINFFQPSMKLVSKQRHGSKIKKLYDKAQTPHQRLSSSSHISEEIKRNLKKQYENLDPLSLLKELKDLQDQLFQYAWKNPINKVVPLITAREIDTSDSKISIDAISSDLNSCEQQKMASKSILLQYYNQTIKPKKSLEPRLWRTRKDPFEHIEERLKLLVKLNPQHTAKNLLMLLIQDDPVQFNLKQLRTLQRRVNNWREINLSDEIEKIKNKYNEPQNSDYYLKLNFTSKMVANKE